MRRKNNAASKGEIPVEIPVKKTVNVQISLFGRQKNEITTNVISTEEIVSKVSDGLESHLAQIIASAQGSLSEEIESFKSLLKDYASSAVDVKVLEAMKKEISNPQSPTISEATLKDIVCAITNDIEGKLEVIKADEKELKTVSEELRSSIAQNEEKITELKIKLCLIVDYLKKNEQKVSEIGTEVFNIENIVETIETQVKGLMYNVDMLREEQREGHKKQDYDHEMQMKALEKIETRLEDLSGNNINSQEGKQQIEKLYEKIKKLKKKIANMLNQGAKAQFPCPYCGNESKERTLNGEGNAVCKNCGNIYEDIDPTELSDEQKKYIKEWRQKHTVTLTSMIDDKDSPLNGKFDMSWKEEDIRKEDIISKKGILIIPKVYDDDKEVTEITQLRWAVFSMPERLPPKWNSKKNEIKLYIPKGVEYDGLDQSRFEKVVEYNW